jgi:hypothetical protein
MTLIIRPRQTGKTTELAEWIKAGSAVTYWPYWDRVIVTFDRREALRVMQKHGLKIGQVFSVDGWRRELQIGYNRNRRPEVAVDNADMILMNLLGPFNTATMTEGEDD